MTDYYDQVEDGVKTKLRAITTLFPHAWQVSDDEQNLRKGGNYFAILLPSTFQTTRVDGKESIVRWNVLFDFYVRFTTKKQSLELFKAGRAELFSLNSDPMLGRTPNVFRVELSAVSEILQDIQGDNPNFIIQTFSAAVSQRIRFVP